MSKVSKKTSHLVIKGGRFYFRMRVPKELVPHLAKTEVTQALGDVNRAQAVVACSELAGQWSAHFLEEKHRLGLAVSPPAPPMRAAIPRRTATPEEVEKLAEASAQRLLAVDEEVRIEGNLVVVDRLRVIETES